MVRTPRNDNSGIRKGTWTPEEDRKLVAYISKYGCWNWRQLPKYAGLSRCGKSCRLRWMNYLRPNIKRGNYTKEEEDIILNLHESLGNRWSTIAAHLPGRTDNEIKNHWHTHLEKKLQKTSISTRKEPKNEITQDKISQPNSTFLDLKTHKILESYPLSPKPSSSELSSSTITDNSSTKPEKFVAEDDAFSSELFEVDCGDFWTEPFLEESYSMDNNFSFVAPLVDAEFFSPFYPFIGEEFLCL
ncbi:hypothetical protein LguiA_022632 [Lonicera macranthoides]